MRTPERRALTGCRWRMSDPRTAMTRLRFVLRMPTRKTDFQICELTMPSCSPRRFAMFPLGSAPICRSQLDERLRVNPLAALLMELLRLIDDDLAIIVVHENLGALEG